MREQRKKQPGHPEPAPPANRAIADWVAYLVHERRRSEGTVVVYMGTLNDFARFLDADSSEKKLVNATTDDIRRYLRVISGVRNVSVASMRRVIATLRSFYEYLRFAGRLHRLNPGRDIRLPELGRRQPKAMAENDVQAFLTAKVHADAEELYLRDRAIFETMYASGIRVAELCRLRIKDVDRETGMLHVEAGKGDKSRDSFVNESALHAIRSYLSIRPDSDTDILFVSRAGKPLTTRAIHRAFVARVKAAGLWEPPKENNKDHDKQRIKRSKKRQRLGAPTPHSLRHSFATHMLRHGADVATVKELLGHSNIATTNVYVRQDMTYMKDVYRKAHPRDKFEDSPLSKPKS